MVQRGQNIFWDSYAIISTVTIDVCNPTCSIVTCLQDIYFLENYVILSTITI